MRLKNEGLQIYSQTDFDNADRMGRLRMYLVEPDKFELTDDEFKFFERVQDAFYLSYQEISRGVAVRKIMSAKNVTTRYANELYDYAQEIFGSFTQVNKSLNKGKIVERLAILADKAFEQAIYTYQDDDGNTKEGCDLKFFEMTERLLRTIATLEGYDRPEPPFDAKKLKIPKIIITSDPQAFLNSRNKDE